MSSRLKRINTEKVLQSIDIGPIYSAPQVARLCAKLQQYQMTLAVYAGYTMCYYSFFSCSAEAHVRLVSCVPEQCRLQQHQA